MSTNKNEKIDLNNKDDVMMLIQEIKAENPAIDELVILSAGANISGWENQPSKKKEGKKAVLKILRISE